MIEEQYNPTMGMPAGLRFAMVTTFYPPANFGGDGHAVRRLRTFGMSGCATVVLLDPATQNRLAGADPRRDCYAIAY